jgi:hypothetical protein
MQSATYRGSGAFEIGEPVEELKGQEVDDAVRPRPTQLAALCRGSP